MDAMSRITDLGADDQNKNDHFTVDRLSAAQLYLELLKNRLLRWGESSEVAFHSNSAGVRRLVKRGLSRVIEGLGGEVVKRRAFDAHAREQGLDWPAAAETMIGRKRLDNLQYCIETVIRDRVPGDLIETGVWRGGASIFMRAVLAAHQDTGRTVWLADSFQGLPAPNLEAYPGDKTAQWHLAKDLAVSLADVKANFERYGLLDQQVRFLEGWFKDTLPGAPIDRLALLRLDGDMYESTIDALNSLYGKLSVGGFVVVDDFNLPEDTCRRAVHDFRRTHDITDPIELIDTMGAFWRRRQ